MKLFIALSLVGVCVATCTAHPGGYIGIGGVYKNMNQKADYMSHAKKACKLISYYFNDKGRNG